MNEWQHLHLWAIAMLLNYPKLQGVRTIYGVDNHVAERARSYSKITGGLETVDEHIHVFSDMHLIEGEVYLLKALVHAAEAPQQFQLDVAASGMPTLVVAGALHFSGPRSVIALLQKRGYKIEQL